MAVSIFQINLGFDQSYVLKSDGVIAIDAGSPGKGERFAQGLKKASINPHDVQLIVLTHGHWDHIGSAKEIKDLTGGRLAMHHQEASWLERSLKPLPPGITLWGKVFIGIHKLFMPLITIPAVTVDVLLGDCVFRSKLTTDSDANWPPIPIQIDQPFRWKLTSDSGAN